MQERDMLWLLQLVDDLLELNIAIKNLGCLEYQGKFQKLDNLYEVIKAKSVFVDCETDEDVLKFYELVDEVKESLQRRMEKLTSIMIYE